MKFSPTPGHWSAHHLLQNKMSKHSMLIWFLDQD
jgi:hypothetical protein